MAVAAWVLFLIVTSSAIALSYPLLRRPLSRLHPSQRANALRVVGMAPVGLATLGVLLCFAPKLFGTVLSQPDHCFEHSDNHAHFCLNHPPQVNLANEACMGLALFVLLAAAIVVVQGLRFRRSSRALKQLSSTARLDAQREAWLIESDLPIAISVGVFRTRTLLSTGLLDLIPGQLVDAVVAHERAHERRRDGLWKPVVELLSYANFPATRRLLMDDLELACEQACDEEAGHALGDRVRVAEALLAMERVRQRSAGLGPAALAFGAHGVPARVESLVSESPGSSWSPRVTLGLLAAAVVAASVAADPLHHLTETLIHYVLG
jgi:beta-lactamase regulating signal transducer with metallopeptidase domain